MVGPINSAENISVKIVLACLHASTPSFTPPRAFGALGHLAPLEESLDRSQRVAKAKTRKPVRIQEVIGIYQGRVVGYPSAERGVAPHVREAILEHLEDLEDMYLAEGALERIRSGEEQTVPLKDVMKRHGLQR
jgi:predicted DNA-binding protein